MTALPRVIHLVDDATAGGVMRVIDYVLTAPDMAKHATHSVKHITRGKVSTQRYSADLIVSHLSISWRNLPMLIAARAANTSTPLVHVEHSYTEAFVALNVTHRGRFSTLLKTAFSLFDRVIAVSHAQAAWITKRGYCRAEKVVTIQSCVDLRDFRAMPASTDKPRILGAIGRLDTQKGFDTLIKAFRARASTDLQLHIYGEGSEELNLRNLAAGDTGIVFKGYATTAQAAFRDVDAVLMPSRWEAYGLVAIEALSAGRLLFCANTDGMRDHMAGGATLLDSNTLSAWTALIDSTQTLGTADSSKSPYRNSDMLEQTFHQTWAALITNLCC